MPKTFYMWLFFGLTATIIVAVWGAVFIKTFRSAFMPQNEKQAVASRALDELEVKLKGFTTINKLLFDQKSAEAQEDLLRAATLQKLKERLAAAASSSTAPN